MITCSAPFYFLYAETPTFPTQAGSSTTRSVFKALKSTSLSLCHLLSHRGSIEILNFFWQSHVDQLCQIVEFHFAPDSLGTLV